MSFYSEIGVAEVDWDGSYNAADCERYKQDEAFVYSSILPLWFSVAKLVPGDQLGRNSRSWLSPPDPSTNYNTACKFHQDGTAMWFFQTNTFTEWNAKGSLLWIYGKGAFRYQSCDVSDFLPSL